jgi:WD40 repeat protein
LLQKEILFLFFRKGGPAHSNLVVAIMYSGVFRQIVSVAVDGTVRLWDIYTGVNVFEFNTTHNSPITAACLDHRYTHMNHFSVCIVILTKINIIVFIRFEVMIFEFLYLRQNNHN